MGPEKRRLPEGVRGLPRGIVGRKVQWSRMVAQQRFKEIAFDTMQRCDEARASVGLEPLPRPAHCKFTAEDLRTGRRCVEAHDRLAATDRPSEVRRETAKLHHELRWMKDDAWKAEHDAACDVCEEWGPQHFGLDEHAMRQVTFARPLIVSKSSDTGRRAHRPHGNGRGTQPTGILRSPTYPWGEAERQRQPAPPKVGQRKGSGESPPISNLESGEGELLHLFAGPPRRRRSVARYARDVGATVLEVDILGGMDICDDDIYEPLLERARRGHFKAAIAGVPCQSYSVLRTRSRSRIKRRRTAPSAARTRERPRGRPNLEGAEAEYLRHHNNITRRAAALLAAVAAAGGEIILENPADRGDTASRLFRWRWRRHVPIWLMQEITELQEATSSTLVTFPQCRLGGDFQKWTTLLATPAAAAKLQWLGELQCTHGKHARVAKGEAARDAAVYPPRLCRALVRAALLMHVDELDEDFSNQRAAELLLKGEADEATRDQTLRNALQ